MKYKNNIGKYQSLDAVWSAYPSGGAEGDYCVIDGVIYAWNDVEKNWFAPDLTPSARKTQVVYGDMDVHNNMTVGGVLSARVVRGRNAFCGLFTDEASLKRHVPKPYVGQWALCLIEESNDNAIGEVYMCTTDGTWTDAGFRGGFDGIMEVLFGESDARKANDNALLEMIEQNARAIRNFINLLGNYYTKEEVDDLLRQIVFEQQADWTETDETKKSFIRHKPDLQLLATKGEVEEEYNRATDVERSLQEQIDGIVAQLNGISLSVTPRATVYAGQQATIHIAVTTASEVSSIVVKRNGTIIRNGSGKSIEFDDVYTPQSAGTITYTAEAVISGNTKSVEKSVIVEEDAVDSITWIGYSLNPSTVQVEMPATFVKGTVIAIYKSGRQEDVTSSAVFNAHRGSIVATIYLAPSTAGEDTIRASYNGKTADSILTVTVIDGQLVTVQVGHGTNYATALFTDTFEILSNNMHVNIDRNAGDYIFIKVGKDDTVNNLYIYNEGGGIFEYIEIALNVPVIDGNYKYYQSANRYNAGTAIPYVINKL